MNKRGKSKLFAILGICIILLLITGVFITAEANSESEQIQEKKDISVSEDITDYVEKFVEKRGIDSDEINNISQINFDDLPKEVNIDNVNDANLAIYQIDYGVSENQEKIFVITYSLEKLRTQGDLIVSEDKRGFLNFGFSRESKTSEFLESSTGVAGSLEKGYVMMRKGSITGISTNLEILSGIGEIEIVIYKNGEAINFGNSFIADSEGVKKDYDIQSKGTVAFDAGDVISAYIKISEGIIWKDVNTLIEITTD